MTILKPLAMLNVVCSLNPKSSQYNDVLPRYSTFLFNISSFSIFSLTRVLSLLGSPLSQETICGWFWHEFLGQEWDDANLRWNESEYGNVSDIRIPPSALWKPDILMYNRYPPTPPPGPFTIGPLQLTKTLYTTTSKDVQTLANSFARAIKTQRESLNLSLSPAVASCATMCLSFGVLT